MAQESSNQSNSSPKPTSTQKPSRPKVNPSKTIGYRQDGDRNRQKRG